MRTSRQPRSAEVVLLALAAALALLVPTAVARPAMAAAPAAPTALVAVPNGNGVDVSFRPAAGATSYELLRNGMGVPTTGPVPVGSTGRLQFSDDTTIRGVHYSYAVRAVSSGGTSASVSTELTQWTDDGSRTWLSSRYGPAECGRTGTAPNRRVICTVLTSAGWQVDRISTNVAWGNPENRAWLTSGGAVDYCNLIGSRPDATRVSCLELGETGWGKQSVSPVTDWGYATDRTWLDSAAGPALCARTGTKTDRRLVCTVRTVGGWKTYRTEHPVDWGYTTDRTWLSVGGTINYCATVGHLPESPKVACVALGAAGWEEQSVSRVTDWGVANQRTWMASAQGPAMCAQTAGGNVRTVVCTTRTSTGWRTDRAPDYVSWGLAESWAWLNVQGEVNRCALFYSIYDEPVVACLQLGADGWERQSVSDVTDWGEAVNRTWIVGSDGPALCARTGSAGLECTVHKASGWDYWPSGTIDWGSPTDRAWVLDQGQISYCAAGGGDADQHVACVKFGGNGFGPQVVSPQTDLGDAQP